MTINMGCWNIGGFNDPMKHVELKNFIYKNNIKICGVVETRVQEQNNDRILASIAPSWKHFDNTRITSWEGFG